MEEIQISAGKIRNPSFTDYLIPTILDVPPMPIEVLEYADPHAPYGAPRCRRGTDDLVRPGGAGGDPPACGLDLNRVPVRPEHITGT